MLVLVIFEVVLRLSFSRLELLGFLEKLVRGLPLAFFALLSVSHDTRLLDKRVRLIVDDPVAARCFLGWALLSALALRSVLVVILIVYEIVVI